MPNEVKEDIQWWVDFAPGYNGVALMLDNDWGKPDQWLVTDSCLTGGGGWCGDEVFHVRFGEEVLEMCLHINQLECITLVVAGGLCGQTVSRKKLLLKCDNLITVWAINSGASRDWIMQCCLRHLHKLMANFSIDVRAVHSPAHRNQVADCLSRLHLHDKYYKQLLKLTAGTKLIWKEISNNMFKFLY